MIRFPVRADGNAQEIGHRGESAAHDDVACAELVDEGFRVRAHIEHDEIGLRGDKGRESLVSSVAEPAARVVSCARQEAT